MPRLPDPPDPTLFVDCALGSGDVPNALRAAGATVETHRDHFPEAEIDDRAWIEETTKRGWIILTKDKRIRRNELEKKTLETTGAAAFILITGEITGQEMGSAFVKALPKIRHHVAKFTRPLVCTVGSDGTVNVLTGKRRGGVRKK